MKNPGRSLRILAIRLKKGWKESPALSVFPMECRVIFGQRKSSKLQKQAIRAAWSQVSGWSAMGPIHIACRGWEWEASPIPLNFPSFSMASPTINESLQPPCGDAANNYYPRGCPVLPRLQSLKQSRTVLRRAGFFEVSQVKSPALFRIHRERRTGQPSESQTH